MTGLIVAVMLASVFGSLHCAGMCGPFVAFAVGSGQPMTRAQRLQTNVAYHGGRLVTYSILGAISGLVGAALNLGGSAVGVQRVAAVVAAVTMVAIGSFAVARILGLRLPDLPVPKFLQKIVGWSHRKASNLPGVARALIIGLCTTLLPCGWLYAFAITAAGTGSAFWGAVTMAAFWVGTLPVLVSLGVSVQALSGAFGKRVPLITSVLIVVIGLGTIVHRLAVPAAAFDEMLPAVSAPSPHGEAIDNAAGKGDPAQEAIEYLQNLDSSELPCCRGQSQD